LEHIGVTIPVEQAYVTSTRVWYAGSASRVKHPD